MAKFVKSHLVDDDLEEYVEKSHPKKVKKEKIEEKSKIINREKIS